LSSSTEIITVSLNEESVLRPGVLAVVSESPFLDELLVGSHDESITEVFLHKSSGVDKLLVLRGTVGVGLLSVSLSLILGFIFSSSLGQDEGR
jgi:hypothetical protein